MNMMQSTAHKILGFTLVAVFIAACAVLSPPAPVGETAKASLYADGEVKVWHDERALRFEPAKAKNTGLIFYPGANVRPESYAMIMRALAREGYTVAVPYMPSNLAIMDVDAATTLRKDYPAVTNWVLGGHSLGGTAAAMHLKKFQSAYPAIMFWASYPDKGSDLSNYAGGAVSIYAELDGLSTPEKIQKATPLLPNTTQYVRIRGGNHAQFGDYGAQKGDNPATISPEEQWEEITAVSLFVLNSVEER